MKHSLLIQDLLDGWRRRPGRTGLVVVAIGLGIAALVFLLGILGGLSQRSATIVRDFGAQLAAVLPVARADHPHPLTETGWQRLRAAEPDASFSRLRRHRAPLRGTGHTVDVVATDEALQPLRNWPLVAGRWLDPIDLAQGQRHAVISRSVQQHWAGTVGDVLILEQTPFRVVGIVDAGDGGAASPLPGALALGQPTVFVPLSVAPAWDRGSPIRPRHLDALLIRPAQGTPRTDQLTRWSHILQGDQPGPRTHRWMTPRHLIGNLESLQRVIRATAGAVIGLCLLLGGITLMSLLIAGIRERVPEIGLRLSLGATPREVGRQFLWEAALLCAVAGALGCATAALALLALGPILPAPVALTAPTLLIPFGVSLALGILFAWGPARLAARITPSEALRNP